MPDVLHAIVVTFHVGNPGKIESDLYLYTDDEAANRKYSELLDTPLTDDRRRVLAIEQLGVPVDAETREEDPDAE
jgi:hypothetical protein